MKRNAAWCCVLAAGVLIAVCLPAWSAEDMRLWTSRDGDETVQARLFAQDETTVTLITANGTSRIVSKNLLSDGDLAWLESAGEAADSSSAGQGGSGRIARALEGVLFDGRGKKAELPATHDGTKFLFYYSASWCPPCRAFTPDLVRFAKRQSADKLTVVLVPSDRSLEESAAYLKDYRMPWSGLDTFGGAADPLIPKNPTGYIPAMVLTDADGGVLLASSKSLSRDQFLKEAAKLLDE